MSNRKMLEVALTVLSALLMVATAIRDSDMFSDFNALE